MIQKIDDDLYMLFQAWCVGHDWPPAPRAMFPEHGYMAYDGDEPVIAGWLYRDPTSAYSMLEYVVSDPLSSRDQRESCFHDLVEHISGVAKELGAAMMHMAILPERRNLGTMLENEGFEVTDQNVTLYLKPL